jgi:hypothetical protein
MTNLHEDDFEEDDELGYAADDDEAEFDDPEAFDDLEFDEDEEDEDLD